MDIQIPKTTKKRMVIIGGGFGGIALVDKLDSELFQTVSNALPMITLPMICQCGLFFL